MNFPLTKHLIKSVLLIFHCSISANTIGQQPLNLNFEKLSVEGELRPWGWDIEYDSEIKILMDSIHQREGDYSLKMTSEKAGERQSLSFSIEAYELVGKTISVSGLIRTQNLSDSAFFTVGYALEKDRIDYYFYDTMSHSYQNNSDWTLTSAQIHIPLNAAFVYVTINHIGSGTSWFDDLSLFADSRPLNEVQIAPPFSNQQINWLSQHSTSIGTVDPKKFNQIDSTDQDLLQFKSMAGESTLIALGESTHGTSEFFRLKHRLLQYAVKEMGVRLFALEDNQVIVERANQFIHGGEGTARASMYGLFSVWQNEEVCNMIQWARDYNDAHPKDKITFIGFDMQNVSLAIDSLSHFTKQFIPDLHLEIDTILSELKENAWTTYLASDSTKLLWDSQTETVLNLVRNRKEVLLSKMTNHQDSSAIFYGIQYATLIKQFTKSLCTGQKALYRDEAMADNIAWTLSQYPKGTKMLIWAHDVHISLGEHQNDQHNYYFGISMGSHLRKKFGQNYKAFGIWTYQGEYLAQIDYYNFERINCPLFSGPIGSLDHALHLVSLKMDAHSLLLNLENARDEMWFNRRIPVRFANHVNFDYGYFTQYNIPYQFDGLFFVDKTSAAKGY